METNNAMNNTRPKEAGLEKPSNEPSSPASNQAYDIVCVGFGPASLAIAIALYDRGLRPRILFLERQSKFGWHTGMLLPGTKMQISFIKDLATLRNPKSQFTFLNYLHTHNRLSHFVNLGTQLPLREEFNDYMSWCASHFNDWVEYGQEVVNVEALEAQKSLPVDSFKVAVRDVRSGNVGELTTKHVVIATGGEPAIPSYLPAPLLNRSVVHSSSYMHTVPKFLQNKNAPYRIAVVGGGQSGAEISEDISSRYPNSKISLITRASALKQSDDSPFVNEIFDPESIDTFYSLGTSERANYLKEYKATNYGVVRLPLLEHLYEKLYRQKLLDPNPENWQLRIFSNYDVCGAKELPSSTETPRVELLLRDSSAEERKMEFDLVVLATGYCRNPFAKMLKPLEPVLQNFTSDQGVQLDRNYRVRFPAGKLSNDAGVWLQGCCERTHGLGDSLLSNLAVRGNEIVDSIVSNNERPAQLAKL